MAGLFEGPFWDPDIYQLETVDPVIGGVPNIATMAGIDNIPHQQLARRTQWLRQQLGGFAGVQQIVANTALVPADMGTSFTIDAPAVVTLPAAASVPAGAAIHVMSSVPAAAVAMAGADTIFGMGASSVPLVALDSGDTVLIRSNGATGWRVIGGSAALRNAGDFGVLPAATGWQRLPSGLILQWGQASFVGLGSGKRDAVVTLPITYPTAHRAAFAVDQGVGTYSIAAYQLSLSQIRISKGAYRVNDTGVIAATSDNVVVNWFSLGH